VLLLLLVHLALMACQVLLLSSARQRRLLLPDR
jgi:hypothetical protein